MLKLTGLALAALTIVVSVGSNAHAQTREDNRQVRQRGRIAAGAATGQLTVGEQVRLQAGQARVQRVENRAQADGTITQREANRLEAAQDRQSGRINRMRTNGRTR